MPYLLDTCALSELANARPDPRVVKAMLCIPRGQMYVSALTVGEINFGIERLRPSARRDFLIRWFDDTVVTVFANRTLPVDAAIAMRWGKLRASLQAKGRLIQVVDGLIATTALVHELTVVTRNESDFMAAGARILNPWK